MSTAPKKDHAAFEAAWKPFIDRVHAESFPGPPHDQDGDVGLLVRKMFVNKLAGDAFRAGWEAATVAIASGRAVSA